MDSFGSVGTVLFWIPVCVLLLAVLGSVWAPAAALTCVLAARFRKLTGESYAWVGAMCSMLLILPWVYLLVRLIFGRSLPVFVVAPVYLIIYAIWLIFYIAVFNVIALVVIIADIFVLHTEPLQISASLFVVLSVMLPMNVYTWMRSARNLHRRYTVNKESPSASAIAALDCAYLAPFIWLSVWSMVVLMTIIVVGLAEFSQR